MLHINDLTYRIGDRLLIDHATVALPTGAKVGLVGKNGAGKTTLFRLIADEIGSETGGVSRPKNSRIGQVAQEAPGRLFDPYALAHFVGARFEQFDLDAVFGLEGLEHDLVER